MCTLDLTIYYRLYKLRKEQGAYSGMSGYVTDYEVFIETTV